MESPELSIIIPAFMEEKRIGATLSAYSDFLAAQKIDYELLVIMDGCTDGTAGIVRGFSEKDGKVRGIEEPRRQGKGAALLKGFSLSKGRFVAFTDADGSILPGEVTRLFEMLRKDEACDAVIGSRWLNGNETLKSQTLSRRIASRGFNRLTRAVLGLPFSDTQCPAKVFRGDVIRSAARSVGTRGFAIDAALLYALKRDGRNVGEEPVAWNDSPGSKLKIRKAAPAMLIDLIRIRAGR